MTKTAKPGDLQITAANSCKRNTLGALVLGGILGAAAYHTVAPAQADSVRAISSLIFKVGSKLCEDWSGLANVERVDNSTYTFTCRRYAEFKQLEVK